jgi:HEAT repeat protein
MGKAGSSGPEVALLSDDPITRSSALDALRQIGSDAADALPEIEKCIADADPRVRQQAYSTAFYVSGKWPSQRP